MTRIRKTGMIVLACVLALMLGFGLASCGGKDTEPAYGYGEEGSYYYTASDGSEYILTLQKGTAIQSYDGGGSTAEYSYDTDEGLFVFTEEGEDMATGSLSEAGLTVTYNGRSYLFLTYEYYTVSFVFGSETLSTQSVLNGKAAQDPGDATKDGCVFLGWYADASFTERYGFNTSITGNTTIYARFVEITSEREYTVTYDYTGETVETVNGALYDLPEPEKDGYTFLGWWVSATNQADELTYRYDGDTLFEDTTLFAFWVEEGGSYIGASVRGDGLTWENYNAAVTDIILLDEEGEEVDRFNIQSTDRGYAYDFSSLPAGKYTIVIRGGGVDESLTYISSALKKVSGFQVISGSILMYNPVENAEGYYITIECGNPAHDHSLIDNGTSLYYDFSSCEMPSTGITFTVYAYADGYYYSVSSYNYFLGLEKTEVTVEGSLVSWTPVSYAMQYEVYIDGTLVATTSDTSYSLSNYGTGTYEISVRPVTTGYYSEASETVTFTKTTLASPQITNIENYTITWTPVEGATGYTVSINGTETTINSGDITSLILSDENYTAGLDEYEIAVKALAPDSANDSPYGETITVTGASVGSAVSYENGTVTWQYSLSASEYRITVNDGDELIVTGTNSSAVTLTKSGNNEITVYFVNDEGDIYGTASITVYAYAIVFDARGGTAYDSEGNEVDTIYVAKGDAIIFPSVSYGAYTADFIGWYTLPDTTDDPDATAYQGDGYLVEDGTVFTGNSTIVLYAVWLNPRLVIALDPGMGTLLDADGNPIYETSVSLTSGSYTIEVPTAGDAAYVFAGWYSEPGGGGVRYTDGDGGALVAFDDISVTTLYAFWAEVLSFSLDEYQGVGRLSVSKGPDIDYVTEITIPEMYTLDGTERETEIVIGTAFADCPDLVTINIPDTVLYIQITSNGYDAGCGVFEGTTLKNINVYATGEPSTTKEIVYYSEGGVLFELNSLTGNVELSYYPYGRTDASYVMPSTVANETEYAYTGSGFATEQVVRPVTALGASVFQGRTEIESITVSDNVTTIEASSFQNCTSLKEAVLPEGLLAIESLAFSGCTSLEEIVLPESLESLGTYAFSKCESLREMTIPGKITELPSGGSSSSNGYGLFGCCYSLTRVTCEGEMTSLGTYTFRDCYSLRVLEVSETYTSIGTYCFYDCYSLVSFTVPASVTSIGGSAFSNCYSLVEIYNKSDLTITAGGTSQGYIGQNALNVYTREEGASRLAYSGDFMFYVDADEDGEDLYYLVAYTGDSPSVRTPDSFNGKSYSIYKYAFYYDQWTTDVTVSTGVDEIGLAAFYSSASLETLTIESMDGDVRELVLTAGASSTGVFGSCKALREISLGNRILTLSSYTFASCSALTEVTIPDSVTSIGTYCFQNCSGIRDVTIGSSVTDIGNYAFYGCIHIITLTIPDSVERIGNSAFTSSGSNVSTSLMSLTLGRGLTEIGQYAFRYCYKLIEVYNLSSLEIIAGEARVTGGAADDYVGYYAKNVYTSTGITGYLVDEDGYVFYEAGGEYFLMGYEGEGTDLVLPEYFEGNTYEIYQHAFSGRSEITSVVIPDTVEIVGEYAFYGCSSLASLTIGEGVKTVGKYAFYQCTALEELYFNATAMDDFGSSSSTNSVFYQAGTGSGGFYLHIAANVTKIPAYMFAPSGSSTTSTSNAPRILHAEFEEGSVCESIGAYAFAYYVLYGDFVIPDSVTTLGNYVFAYDTSLESITFGKGITSVGTYICASCTYLTEMHYNIVSTSVSFGAASSYFNNVGKDGTGLTVYFGEDVTAVPANLFYRNSSASSSYATGVVAVVFEGNKVESIGNYAFYNCNSLTTVYYKGTPTQWGSVTIGTNNDFFTGSDVLYYSETEPSYSDGNDYWHWVDGEVVVWKKD